MLKKTLYVLFFVFLAAQGTARAEIQLARVFGNGMVLQREMAVPVWGQARTCTTGKASWPCRSAQTSRWRSQAGLV